MIIRSSLLLALACSTAVAVFAGSDDRTGKREHAMANCPSAVLGATTTVRDHSDGVEVRIGAPNPTAQAEIRLRARHQGRVASQASRGSLEHTGQGTGSGRSGFCPGLLHDTRIDVEDTPDGARMTVHARNPLTTKHLQRLTHERLQALSY
jgi:hypothetical protein